MAQGELTRRVLVVDSEPQIHRLVAVLLGDGHRVDGATNPEIALDRIHQAPYDVIIIDEEPSASGVTGIELLRKVRRVGPELAVILFTSRASVKTAIEAMRYGAFDYLPKTVGASELRSTVARASDHGSLTREVRRLRSEVDKARGVGQMVGESAPVRQLLALAERVAGSDATVLILGESGTGKELLARTVHRLGPRSDKPFVAFDCSALTPTLLEAELFGHEKGAFTGAGKARRGLFREAHGGTIFLDEIGDIAPSVQNKLLRVLQEREIKPVGGDHNVKIDVKVIAATNKDLRALVARGEFREDLYWRLAVVPIQVPPLRERAGDIPLLCAAILAKRRGAAKSFAGDEGRYPTRVSARALDRLMEYRWPGNIRELENVLSRAAILCDGEEIDAGDLEMVGLSERDAPSAPSVADPGMIDAEEGLSLPEATKMAVRSLERRAIITALDASGGSPARAARRLGISRASVYNKMRDYGIRQG